MGKVFVGLIRDHRTRIGRIIARGARLRYGGKGKVEN